MANVPLPDASEPLVLKDGRINPVWHRFFRDLLRRIAALE